MRVHMWYVVQVRTGTEEVVKMQCLKIINHKILEDCFIPYYELMKKYEGKWHKEKRILFPGYVFMVSSNVDELFLELKNVDGLTKVLGTGEEVVPLENDEIEFLKAFGKKEQLVEMSEGIIDGGKVCVVDGPLKGYEGWIKKVDRHKRLAYLEVELMDRKIETRVGLEIVEKKEDLDNE